MTTCSLGKISTRREALSLSRLWKINLILIFLFLKKHFWSVPLFLRSIMGWIIKSPTARFCPERHRLNAFHSILKMNLSLDVSSDLSLTQQVCTHSTESFGRALKIDSEKTSLEKHTPKWWTATFNLVCLAQACHCTSHSCWQQCYVADENMGAFPGMSGAAQSK